MKRLLIVTTFFISSFCLSAPYPDVIGSSTITDYWERESEFDFEQFEPLPPFEDQLPDEITSFLHPTNQVIICSDQDVIMGRGGKANHHPGNVKFRDTIKANRSIYRSIFLKNIKTQMTMEILDMIKGDGVRFLDFDKASGRWFEVSDERARQKISQCLREKPH